MCDHRDFPERKVKPLHQLCRGMFRSVSREKARPSACIPFLWILKPVIRLKLGIGNTISHQNQMRYVVPLTDTDTFTEFGITDGIGIQKPRLTCILSLSGVPSTLTFASRSICSLSHRHLTRKTRQTDRHRRESDGRDKVVENDLLYLQPMCGTADIVTADTCRTACRKWWFINSHTAR